MHVADREHTGSARHEQQRPVVAVFCEVLAVTAVHADHPVLAAVAVHDRHGAGLDHGEVVALVAVGESHLARLHGAHRAHSAQPRPLLVVEPREGAAPVGRLLRSEGWRRWGWVWHSADIDEAVKPTPGGRAALRRALGTVFLRDWHPVLRDPLDLFRLSFVAGAAVFAIQGDGDAVVRLLFPALAVFVVRALNVPRAIDWIFCVAMAFQGWGNALHLFTRLSWYDNTVHITLPMSLAPILYIGFARLDIVPDPAEEVGIRSELIGMALITACIGVTAASAYEIYEWVVNNWFGQHLFIGEADTINDLADGFLGAGIGGFLLASWAVSRYGTRRVARPAT